MAAYTAGFMASVTLGLAAEDRDQLRSETKAYGLWVEVMVSVHKFA